MSTTLVQEPARAPPLARPAQIAHDTIEIGRVDDPAEHEAERVAARLMRMPEPGGGGGRCACGGVAGPGGECAACKAKRLQRRASGPAAGVAPPIVHEVLASPGRPLDSASRAYFEPRLGIDLGAVRVHEDARAAESARAVGAQAYAVGDHIALPPGNDGLLAHELTHVAQQREACATLRRAPPPSPAAPASVRIAPSSTFEDGKASVRGAYERLGHQQVEAVNLLEKTVALKDPAQKDLVGDIIKLALAAVMDLVLDLVTSKVATMIAERAVRRMVPTMTSDEVKALFKSSEAAKTANKALGKQLKSGITGLWDKVATPKKGPSPLGTTGGLLFFHYERAALAQQSEDRVVDFNNTIGALFGGLSDQEAIVALDLYKESIDAAADEEIMPATSDTYLASLENYLNFLAMSYGGVTTAQQHAAGETDAAKISGPGIGILRLDVSVPPTGRPSILAASIDGLNAQLRPLLAERPVGSLGMNVFVNAGAEAAPSPDYGLWQVGWASRNTGGTVDYGPREPHTAGHFVAINFFAHRAVPDEKVQLWGHESFLTPGSYGIQRGETRLTYGGTPFAGSDTVTRDNAEIDATLARFRQLGFTGARLLIEQDIFPLPLPKEIGGGPSTREPAK